jgi:hypothetical protein
MKEFIFLFRMDIISMEAQPTSEQMEEYMRQWMKWINEISETGQLAKGGNHLSRSGRLLRPKNVISDGPYAANKESVAGYIIILAKDMDDAVRIAGRCPILQGEGTSVEVREVEMPESMHTVRKTSPPSNK